MKKSKKCLVCFMLVLVIVLAACGSDTSEETSAMKPVTEGETMSEALTGEFLADSLEYLLKDEPEREEEKTPVKEETGKKETADEEAVLSEVEVTIYYGNGASEELNTEVSSMEQITAENLIKALVRHNIVSLGTKVNFFEELETDGVRTLHLDLSKTFPDYLKTMTKEGEDVIMSSMAATFLHAFDAEKMVITIDGAVLETEYAVYEEPIQYRPEHLTVPEK